MINFTRASTATYTDAGGELRLAAVNEPRFEKEGILIEGTSTNLYTPDSMLQNRTDGNWVANPTTVRLGNVDFKITRLTNPKLISFNSCYGWTSLLESFTGGTYAVTAMYKKHPKLVGLVDPNQNQRGISPNIEFVNGLPSKGVKRCTLLGYSIHGEYVILKYTVADPTSTPTIVTMNFSSDIVIDEAEFGIVQVEKLPFATSYIPTTDTTVTRAADSLSVGSFLEFAEGQTFSTYLDIPTGNTDWACLLETDNSKVQLSASGSLNMTGGAVYPTKGYSGSGMYTFTGDRGKQEITMYYKGTVAGVYKVSGVGSKVALSTLFLGDKVGGGRAIYGHIRNFRQWKFALTPEQVLLLQGAI